MTSLNDLIAEYAAWNAANGLALGSADEHLFDDNLTAAQQDWLRAFVERWEQADRDTNAVVASSDAISINDDGMGSETYLRIVHTTTCLALRRAVRDANLGHIPIYSSYDCTGLVCGQWAKLIKVYKTYGGFTGVVEMTVTRDI